MQKSTLIAIVSSALLVLAICVSTLSPHPLLPNDALWGDKVQHLLGFGSLVVPAALLRPRWLTVVAPATIIFGGTIEVIQTYIGRDGEIGDFMADVTGVFLAVSICSIMRKIAMWRSG
ncbi:teicoplanin resistance protein VanZ [Phaeovulum sp. W22_SRMD_FR3]|uniref:teicoplanin resistance protein VanZ n=1 Tax=Phaeovulum sp. W22_SRMD_FR3 TaxID=3240274 RepID=UPI003F980AC0